MEFHVRSLSPTVSTGVPVSSQNPKSCGPIQAGSRLYLLRQSWFRTRKEFQHPIPVEKAVCVKPLSNSIHLRSLSPLWLDGRTTRICRTGSARLPGKAPGGSAPVWARIACRGSRDLCSRVNQWESSAFYPPGPSGRIDGTPPPKIAVSTSLVSASPNRPPPFKKGPRRSGGAELKGLRPVEVRGASFTTNTA